MRFPVIYSRDVVYPSNMPEFASIIPNSRPTPPPTPFATTWGDLEFIIPSEVRQKVKDRQHAVSLTRGT